jgi:hypothetical protein
LEIVEAPRAVPLLSPGDYRVLDAYLIHHRLALPRAEPAGMWRRLATRMLGAPAAPARRASEEHTEVWTALDHLRFAGDDEGRRLLSAGPNPLGRIPVVHVQNLAIPFSHDGLSEVEPLIPLQDELNIRLSDRANRVTLQSFKMYLGRGIEGFGDKAVGPGQMWATDNPDASITEFGGDAASPSETAHIQELRDALDKTSGVSPVAAGLLRGRVGHLTSENALRVALMGLLAKTERKRVSYGSGIERLCDLVLHAADVLGVLPNHPDERRVRVDWPSAIPENGTRRLEDARIKLELGVPRRQVLAELGYDESAESA